MKNYIFVSKDEVFSEPHPDMIVYEPRYPHRIVLGFGVGDSPREALSDMLKADVYRIYPAVRDVICYEVGGEAVGLKMP